VVKMNSMLLVQIDKSRSCLARKDFSELDAENYIHLTTEKFGTFPREKIRRNIDQTSCSCIVSRNNEDNSSTPIASTRRFSCAVKDVIK
jgi:hypothetical protein